MLKERISILHQNGVISDDVAQFTDRVIDMMTADYPQIDVDRSIRFTTHLAMAGERIRNGGDVDEMDEESWQELMEEPMFPQAEQFLAKMLALCTFEFPENEHKFIMLHICDMLSN